MHNGQETNIYERIVTGAAATLAQATASATLCMLALVLVPSLQHHQSFTISRSWLLALCK